MINHRSHPNLYFWFLIAVTSILIGFAVAIGWDYVQVWGQILWQLCQNSLQHLAESLWLTWPLLLIPIIISVMTLRGGLSIVQQVRAFVYSAYMQMCIYICNLHSRCE